MKVILWWLGAVGIASAALIFGDLQHFTWWATIQFYAFSLLMALGYGQRYWVVYVVQGVLVVVTIVTMSLLGCDVLEDAADDFGALYIPLNFALHYLPLILALSFPPTVPIPRPREQCAIAIGFFALYTSNLSPANVYGCQIPLWAPAAATLVLVGLPFVFPQTFEPLITTSTHFEM